MALLKHIEDQPIGLAFFAPPGWRQGYYWRPGMADAQFFDHPKQLANDTVWFTNAGFEITKNLGLYMKHYRFFRVPMQRLLSEFQLHEATLDQQVQKLGPFFSRMSTPIEAKFLYTSETLIAAMRETIPIIPTPELTWQQLGTEARTWYWKGAVKNKLLKGGSLYLPRFDYARQIIKCQVPDFSKPPEIIKGDFKSELLRQLLKEHVGFVRLRIENVKPEIREFIDLSRTLWTTPEVLWLLPRADITAKYLYLTKPIAHPSDNPEKLIKNFKPFSWLDGLRLENLALAPGYKNIAMEAYLRGIAHVGMAHYAEYLLKYKSIAAIALSYGKLGIAFNRTEELTIRTKAAESGLFFKSAEDEGVDLTIGQGI